jgi:tetratricopeptide (TPR) repeat protein
MNHRLKLVLPVFSILVLLVHSQPGAGQQAPAATLESFVAAAQKAQAVGDFAAAASDYNEAVMLSPGVPELWANLGLMQHESGNISGALVSFQHANRLSPSLYVPNLFLGIDLTRTGKAREAIPFLIKATKTNKSDPQAALALGRAYVVAGKFSNAADELQRATALDPKLGAAWFTLGIARLDQVEADARTLSTDSKDSSFAGSLYAESLQKQARFGEAATLYKSLLSSQPQPPCLRAELGFSLLREHDPAGATDAFAAERTVHPECGLALLGQARMALEASDNHQAASLLTELWNRDHGFVSTHAALLLEGLSGESASAFVNFISAQKDAEISGDLGDALLSAFGGSNQNPVNRVAASKRDAKPASGMHSAEEQYRAGQFESCAHGLTSSFSTLNAGNLRLLAACAFFTGDDPLAARAASALGNAQPRSLEALYWSIQANEHLALQALARFQQLEPDSARSHVLLGDIFHQLERHDDAQAEYQKALAIAPGDPAALLGLASACLSNNNNDGAIETAKAALVRSPNDPELNLIVGEAMLAKNDYVGAEPSLRKALRAKPQMIPHVHALLGKIDAETGRTEQAIEELKLGASSDEDGAIQYLLARLYRKLGNTEAANAALERMKIIKQQRRARGIKRVEDPELSSLELSGSAATP